MTKRLVRGLNATVACACLLAAAACDEAATRTTAPEFTLSASMAVAGGLTVYGNGSLRRASPKPSCASAEHRAFDFWLGEWDVYDVNDNHIGTNIVRREIDGCAVIENWVSDGGFAGRSLNAYDAETGLWYQTYMAGGAGGHLDMSGGPDESADMHLVGDRHFASGFVIEDDWSWNAEGSDIVRQTGVSTFLPPGDEPSMGTFVGVYRAGDVTPAASNPSGFCGPMASIGFMIGSWVVSATSGPTLGTSVVSDPAEVCMYEERFTTPKGIEAITYFWWQPAPDGGPFHSVYVDSEGERIQLAGDLVDGRLVLTGEETGRGRAGDLRVVWEATGDGPLQTWSESKDGGATWRERLALAYSVR